METPIWFLVSYLLLLTSLLGGGQFVESLRPGKHLIAKKLFVFGDSYADTGNSNRSASSWNFPYGITFPGKPAGRYSDGIISTDFIAKYLKIKTPIPYKFRKQLHGRVKYGMNFAYGGTGVSKTLFSDPNMTVQIDFLQKLLKENVYTKRELKSSVAVLSIAGNDYAYYTATNGSALGWPFTINSVVNQIGINMKRLHNMGFRKVAVNTLEPLGCLPATTFKLSFQKCNTTQNTLVDLHNQLLKLTVAKLNSEATPNSFVILDLNTAFFDVFSNKTVKKDEPTFKNPYMPCCIGVSTEYSCGSVDGKGNKMYTVCADPKSTFFWDYFHPTQQGWHAVFATPAMSKSLEQL